MGQGVPGQDLNPKLPLICLVKSHTKGRAAMPECVGAYMCDSVNEKYCQRALSANQVEKHHIYRTSQSFLLNYLT